MRETRGAVVAADDDQRVLAFARAVQFGEDGADGGVPGLDLTQVVGQILADDRYVGEEGWHLAFEFVGIDAPEFLAAALDPCAVDVGGAEPVGEGFPRLAGGEHRAEVLADLVEQLFARRFNRGALGHHLGHVLGEVVKLSTCLLESVGLATVRGVARGAGAPDLVGFSEVIAGIAQQERVGGDGGIPDGALQDGAAASPPEVLTGEQRTATRRAGGRVDVRVAEEHALAGELVEVRGTDDVVDPASSVSLSVDAGEATPVVGEEEEDVGPFHLRGGEERGREGQQAEAKDVHFKGAGSQSEGMTQFASSFSPRRYFS